MWSKRFYCVKCMDNSKVNMLCIISTLWLNLEIHGFIRKLKYINDIKFKVTIEHRPRRRGSWI